MQTIKMKVVDWWNPDNEANFDSNPFIKLLRQKYEIIYSNAPDFLLCGPFGHKHFEYDCVKIFYTGENIRVDWNLYDYGMGFEYMDFGARYLHLPLFYLYNYDFESRTLGERKRFCAYIVRHSGAIEWGAKGGLRDRFFDKLSAYKRVDSGGGWRNNIGGAVENKGEWLKDYKFNICFENSSYAGYLTEKLFDAYNAGCVPIYWGDTSLRICSNSSLTQFSREFKKSLLDRRLALSHADFSAQPTNLTQDTRIANDSKDSSLRDLPLVSRGKTSKCEVSCNPNIGGGNRTCNPHDLDSIDTRIPQISPHLLEYKINPKAFINAHNFPNLDALVAEVKRIDSDKNAYNAMRNEPLFLESFSPKAFYERRILAFFDNIFSQNPNLAFMRGEGQHLYSYRAQIANLAKCRCLNLTNDALNLARLYDKIHKATRKFRYKLKFWRF